MNNYNWEYGNISRVDGNLQSYSTLYIDKANTDASGLILLHKDKTIGFISLIRIAKLLNKIYVSKTGLLLIDASFYIDALVALEEFVVSEGVVIISKIDYIYADIKGSSKVTNFFGNKQTIINTIDTDVDSWLLQMRSKHRYYVRKAIKNTDQKCEIKVVDHTDLSLLEKMYDIYDENMGNKGVKLLFSTRDEFISFINRNLKNIIITICFRGDEISYFNVVHTNIKVANYLMAVTTKSGKSSFASYEGVYKLYDYLYSHNFQILNFGGVDSVHNHGVYLFKKGFSGELLESSSYMVVGKGLTAWVAKKILQLRMLIKFR